MLYRLWILMTLFMATISGFDQSIPIPYIHYYDYLRGGLVIERADGTDSRLIPDLIPDGHNAALMPEWSASGKWFVSSTYEYNAEPVEHNLTTVIAATDGGRKIDLGSSLASRRKFLWSPVEDVLFVFSADRITAQTHLYLLDVESEILLAEETYQGAEFDIWSVNLHWSGDGQRAFVGIHADFFALHRDGQVEQQSYQNESVTTLLFQDGFLFYLTDEQTQVSGVLEHPETGRKISFVTDKAPYNSSGRYFYRLWWNAQHTHVLISVRQCAELTCTQSLTMLTWADGTIWDVPLQAAGFGECADWELRQPYCPQDWSPDGRFILIIDRDDSLSVIDMYHQHTQPIAALNELDGYRWSGENTLFLFHRGKTTLHHYDPQTQTTIEIPLPEGVGRYLVFPSPRGGYLGLMSSSVHVINYNGDLVRQILPHRLSVGIANHPFTYAWHESEHWGIVEYTLSVAGGGIGPMAPVIFETTSALQRDLPIGSQAGFLPASATRS